MKLLLLFITQSDDIAFAHSKFFNEWSSTQRARSINRSSHKAKIDEPLELSDTPLGLGTPIERCVLQWLSGIISFQSRRQKLRLHNTRQVREAIMIERTYSVPTRHHPFELVVSQTALLIIDMQIDFCDRTGFCSVNLNADVSAMQNLIPRLQRVIRWARSQGVWIIYTRESHKPDLSDLSPSKQLRYTNAGYPVSCVGNRGRFLVQGEAGTEIIPELTPLADDWQLDKPAQSAFVNTLLETQLHDRSITHLLVTGVTTECCVLGTYRQASDLGFYALLLEDCCAAFNAVEHDAAIAVVLAEDGAIGWVTTSEQLIRAIP